MSGRLPYRKAPISKKRKKVIAIVLLCTCVIAYLGYAPKPNMSVMLYQNQANNNTRQPQVFTVGDSIYITTALGTYQYREGKAKWLPFVKLFGVENEHYVLWGEKGDMMRQKVKVVEKSTGKTVASIQGGRNYCLYKDQVYYSRIHELTSNLHVFNIGTKQDVLLMDSIGSYRVKDETTIVFTKDEPTKDDILPIYLLENGIEKTIGTINTRLNYHYLSGAFIEDETLYYNDFYTNQIISYNFATQETEIIYTGEFERFQNVYNGELYLTKIINQNSIEVLKYNPRTREEINLISLYDRVANNLAGETFVSVLSEQEVLVKMIASAWLITEEKTEKIVP